MSSFGKLRPVAPNRHNPQGLVKRSIASPRRKFPPAFVSFDNGADVLLGIELKGWYRLAKEEAPTYRFTVTPAACNEHDLLVVVPWVLSNILAGFTGSLSTVRRVRPLLCP